VQRQVAISIGCEGQRFDGGFRAGWVVERKVIVEINVEDLPPADKKRLLTCCFVTLAI
jgi:hypothetical protein